MNKDHHEILKVCKLRQIGEVLQVISLCAAGFASVLDGFAYTVLKTDFSVTPEHWQVDSQVFKKNTYKAKPQT